MQHRLRQRGEQVWRALSPQGGGYIYVAGNSKVPSAVKKALLHIFQTHGGLTQASNHHHHHTPFCCLASGRWLASSVSAPRDARNAMQQQYIHGMCAVSLGEQAQATAYLQQMELRQRFQCESWS